jgi:hypothetical protein
VILEIQWERNHNKQLKGNCTLKGDELKRFYGVTHPCCIAPDRIRSYWTARRFDLGSLSLHWKIEFSKILYFSAS